jgi:hypothetical protein
VEEKKKEGLNAKNRAESESDAGRLRGNRQRIRGWPDLVKKTDS